MSVPLPEPAERNVKNLLSHLRHDLRTPVNAIIGYGEMLLEDASGSAPPAFVAILQEVPALGKQLLQQISQLLDTARVEALGERPDLGALTAQLEDKLAPPASATIRHALALTEQAGPAGLEEFLPDLARVEEAGRRLLALLEVSKNLQWQAAPAPGAAPAAAVPGDAPVIVSDRPLVPGHLLIVDDNDFNRDLLGRAVTRNGHTFAVARHGRQALEMLAAAPYDLVLLDVTMPEMDGVQALKHLKADPKLKHIPVIMISALDEIDTVVRCIEMGAEDYLAKPCDPVLLKARIGACLEKKHLRDQELEYLRNVAVLTTAVSAVEAGSFDTAGIDQVAQRTDALGKLGQMLQNMAREVHAREERLKQQVQALKVEIDETRKAKAVAEITETSYFSELQQRVSLLRKRRDKPAEPNS